MARVTVEDCIDKVDSPYELVLVAKERATQLNSGLEPSVPRENDKNTVIALREIADEKIKVKDLTESGVYKLRKHVEQIDESSESDEDIGDDFESLYIADSFKSLTLIVSSAISLNAITVFLSLSLSMVGSNPEFSCVALSFATKTSS